MYMQDYIIQSLSQSDTFTCLIDKTRKTERIVNCPDMSPRDLLRISAFSRTSSKITKGFKFPWEE